MSNPLSNMRPHVARITELDPRRRRIHVRGEELHPGELAGRGYAREGGEWVLELRRPGRAEKDADALTEEFRGLQLMGYGFAEGDEWSPAELCRRLLGGPAIPGGR